MVIRNTYLRAALVAVAGLAATAVLYRLQFQNGFVMLFGEQYDGLLAITILEHWYNVAIGASPWHTTFYFFPAFATLGYGEGFLAHGLVHAALRLGGLDIFPSSLFCVERARGRRLEETLMAFIATTWTRC